jgi:hypothetical protein
LFLQILHLFVHQNDSSATLDEVFGFHVNFREQSQAVKRQNKIEQVLPTLSDTVAVVVAQIGDAFQGQASFDVRPEGYGAVVGPLDVVESCEFCEGLNQHVEVFGHAEMRGYESALLEACHGFFVDRLFLGFVENERESGHDGSPDEAKQFLVELTTVDVVVEAIFGDALAKEDLPKVVFSNETRLFGWHYYFFVLYSVVNFVQHVLLKIVPAVHPFQILLKSRQRHGSFLLLGILIMLVHIKNDHSIC